MAPSGQGFGLTYLATNLHILLSSPLHGHGRRSMVPAQLLNKRTRPLLWVGLELSKLVRVLEEGYHAL